MDTQFIVAGCAPGVQDEKNETFQWETFTGPWENVQIAVAIGGNPSLMQFT